MKSTLFLDIVVRKSAAVLKLLAGKDKTLLVRRNAFFILNLGFHVVDSVRRLNLERNGLPRQGLDEYLHSTTKTENKVEGGLLLNVIVRQGATVLELLAREDKALLVGWNAMDDT